ncbi:Inner membrane protein YrbG [Halioglobus japonicus]|nr:Inner membrane protein YrbG [Halioglobus japonicus]
MTFFLLVLGLTFLLLGGTALVRGASGIASEHGVSPLLVGLTVVAFGTSAPELVVNVIGAISNETELAFGNVVGSNLANLGLVLCMAALIKPMKIQGQIVRRELPLLLLGSTVLLVMTLDTPLTGSIAMISRSDGIILLLLFSIFLYLTISDVLQQREDPLIANMNQMKTMIPPKLPLGMRADWIYVGFGIAALGAGGQLTISEGSELASALGVSPVVIGMLVVAIGTSLPELVTSVIAAFKDESDLCVGNIIGSNIFNFLFVLPISALIRPLPIPAGGIFDILLTLAFTTVLLVIFFYGRATLNRMVATVMIASYAGYMALRALT